MLRACDEQGNKSLDLLRAGEDLLRACEELVAACGHPSGAVAGLARAPEGLGSQEGRGPVASGAARRYAVRVDSPASGGLRDLAPALASLPLFPLPTVLFPGALLPLHIFEPRYRAMVRDLLDGHGALAVVLVTGPDEVDEHGHPRIARVAGAGVIVDHAELPSGRFNILVRGRARVSLDELPFGEKPYRRARATVLSPTAGETSPADLAALISAAGAFAARVRERDHGFELPIPKDAPAGVVADLCAHHLILDPRERQAALETLDVGERVRKVADVLALQHVALSPDPRGMN